MSDRKRVYIACPISKGDPLHNIQQADDAFFALLKAGFAPFNPIWSMFADGAYRSNSGAVAAYASHLPRGTIHEDWMEADLPWVAVAHAVLRLPGESRGADMEVLLAHKLNIPVFFGVNDLIDNPLYFGK